MAQCEPEDIKTSVVDFYRFLTHNQATDFNKTLKKVILISSHMYSGSMALFELFALANNSEVWGQRYSPRKLQRAWFNETDLPNFSKNSPKPFSGTRTCTGVPRKIVIARATLKGNGVEKKKNGRKHPPAPRKDQDARPNARAQSPAARDPQRSRSTNPRRLAYRQERTPERGDCGRARSQAKVRRDDSTGRYYRKTEYREFFPAPARGDVRTPPTSRRPHFGVHGRTR